MSESKRGANGGNARAEKLTKEQRSSIAKGAAQKRWAKKKITPEEEQSLPEPKVVSGFTISNNGHVVDVEVNLEPFGESTVDAGPKHCPACMMGQSLEEGEGTHVLATVEHPVMLPSAFEDSDSSVSIAASPVSPIKPPKRQTKPMPKELKTASSYSEKRLPQAIKEKADLLVEVARREAEIQELTRVIQALGGHIPIGVPVVSQYQNPPYQPPSLPPLYPEYQQPSPVTPQVTPVKPMKAGGAGVAQGMLEVPDHWYNG